MLRAMNIPRRAEARSHAREASQRYRGRVKRREATACVIYGEEVVAFLLRCGWLTEDEADNRQAVGRAIARLLEVLLAVIDDAASSRAVLWLTA
jgi:hypothetical protein